MSADYIPVSEPYLVGNEERYALECLRSGWISSEGPFVKRFEDSMARRVDRKFGIAVSSGSTALDVAVAALGLGPGDEVIVPTFTIISCVSAILRVGARPVLVDADSSTWNMDVRQVEARITPRTRAIMVVHLYGMPADLDPILTIARRNNLKIIEDAAQMLGQTYRGQPCGSFGDISTFSFYANKVVTTGEGGMIMTNEAGIAESCRSLRNLCFNPERRFVHDEVGWNFRMTSLQAAIGLAQLEQLDHAVERRRRMGKMYTELASEIAEVEMVPGSLPYAESIYWVFGLVLSDSVKVDAKTIIAQLSKRGVGSRPFFWPMHEQPALLKQGLFKAESYPVAERIARRGFYLPSGTGLTDEQCHLVMKTLRQVLVSS